MAPTRPTACPDLALGGGRCCDLRGAYGLARGETYYSVHICRWHTCYTMCNYTFLPGIPLGIEDTWARHSSIRCTSSFPHLSYHTCCSQFPRSYILARVPSRGQGADFLEYIMNTDTTRAMVRQLLCCEIQPEMAAATWWDRKWALCEKTQAK